MKEKKVYIGIRDGMLVIGTMSLNDINKKHYWYKNTETKREVYNKDELETRGREYLDDGESWKMAVAAGNTTYGEDEWIESVLNIDGAQHVLDTEQIGEYYFSWDCIGGFEENKNAEYKKLFISPEDFKFFFTSQKDISVGSAAEKKLLAFFDKYADHNEKEIAEFAREEYLSA